MQVRELVESVASLLLDVSGTRWTSKELRSYLEEGQRKLVELKPSAYVIEISIDLSAGAYQSLPPDALVLQDILYNDNDTRDAVTRVVLEDLDTVSPSWRVDNPSAVVQHYVYDMTHPDLFYVYPAQPSDDRGTVRVLVSAVPPKLDTAEQTLVLRDKYQPALIDYMLYKAYQKDNEEPENRARSNEAYQRFLIALGLRMDK